MTQRCDSRSRRRQLQGGQPTKLILSRIAVKLLLVTIVCRPVGTVLAGSERRTLVGRDEICVLMGSDAQIQGGITEHISGDHVHRSRVSVCVCVRVYGRGWLDGCKCLQG